MMMAMMMMTMIMMKCHFHWWRKPECTIVGPVPGRGRTLIVFGKTSVTFKSPYTVFISYDHLDLEIVLGICWRFS